MFPQVPFELRNIPFVNVKDGETFEINAMGERLIIPQNIVPQDLMYQVLQVAFNQPSLWLDVLPLSSFDVDFEKIYIRHRWGFVTGSLASNEYHVPDLKICIVKNRKHEILNFRYHDKLYIFSDYNNDFNWDAHIIPYGAEVAVISVIPKIGNVDTYDLRIQKLNQFNLYEEIIHLNNIDSGSFILTDTNVKGFSSIKIDLNATSPLVDTFSWMITYE